MSTDERRAALNETTQTIIACALKVSNTLGVGFLERVYENALSVELRGVGLKAQQQYPVKVLLRAWWSVTIPRTFSSRTR